MESLKVKDSSIVFSKGLTTYTTRPSDDARYLIRRNLQGLVENICKDALEFSHSAFIKLKALNQLKHTIVLAEADIQQHTDYIIRALIRLYHKEDKHVDAQINIIFELLGIYSHSGLYVPIIIDLLSEEEVKASTRLVSNLLELSSYLICHENVSTLQDEIEIIVKVIESIENAYNENVEIMASGYTFVANFIYVIQEHATKYRSRLFSYLLTLQSIPSIPTDLANRIENCMNVLAQNSGHRDIKELYSIEVSSILNSFYESKIYKSWDRNSKDRFKFNLLVKHCGRGLAEYLPVILEILEALVSQEADLETKFDALTLIEFLINLDEMIEQMRINSFTIMSKILIPATIWRAGNPLVKIRKAGITCMIQLIRRQIIPEDVLQECIGNLKPVLKTCLNDDWAPDLRFSATVLLDLTFSHLRETLTDMDLSDLYPHLLERLDDSQDMIRIEITKAIVSFFQCSKLKMSPGTFEYVVRNILIHLDDQNENLRLSLFNVLQSAARVKPKLVLKEARASIPKQNYPQICQELVRWIEENLEEELRNSDDLE